MAGIMIATGAYGREANIQDWKDGKDFKSYYGPYFSIRDTEWLKRNEIHTIHFMDRSGQKVFEISTGYRPWI